MMLHEAPPLQVQVSMSSTWFAAAPVGQIAHAMLDCLLAFGQDQLLETFLKGFRKGFCNYLQ
jgi:hypothetical protein